eukprot:m.65150 g.65150  ORF g.65150 m.65150 type:complete len:307 (-) comp12584_c0_seq3:1777-2697(-)
MPVEAAAAAAAGGMGATRRAAARTERGPGGTGPVGEASAGLAERGEPARCERETGGRKLRACSDAVRAAEDDGDDCCRVIKGLPVAGGAGCEYCRGMRGLPLVGVPNTDELPECGALPGPRSSASAAGISGPAGRLGGVPEGVVDESGDGGASGASGKTRAETWGPRTLRAGLPGAEAWGGKEASSEVGLRVLVAGAEAETAARGVVLPISIIKGVAVTGDEENTSSAARAAAGPGALSAAAWPLRSSLKMGVRPAGVVVAQYCSIASRISAGIYVEIRRACACVCICVCIYVCMCVYVCACDLSV